MNAVAAIEIACWDIIGKETGRPIYDLLGGRYHERLPVYANGWYQGERTPEMFAEKAQEVVARGYKALKFDPFGAAWRTMTQDDRRLSLDIVEAVRDAVGPEIQIMIEGHRRFSVAEAIWVGDRAGRVRPDLVRGADRPHQDRRHGRGRAPSCRSRSRPARASPARISSPSCWRTTAVHILQPDPSQPRRHPADADGLRDGRRPLRRRRAASGAGTDLDRGLRPDRRLHAEPARPGAVRRVQRRLGARDRHLAPAAWPRTARSRSRQVRALAAISSWSEVEKHPYQVSNFLPLFAPGWEKREGERPSVPAADQDAEPVR